MTLTQYKKAIKALSRQELEKHLFEMFKSSKAFKDIESSYWSIEYNAVLLVSLEDDLEKVFWKEEFSLGECKRVLNDYLNRTIDEKTQALMHLAFANEAGRVSAAYGDYGERFYDSFESSAEKYLDYAKLHPEIFFLHEDEFEKLISASDSLGYGVSEILEDMLEDAREELGNYDDLYEQSDGRISH